MDPEIDAAMNSLTNTALKVKRERDELEQKLEEALVLLRKWVAHDLEARQETYAFLAAQR